MDSPKIAYFGQQSLDRFHAHMCHDRSCVRRGVNFNIVFERLDVDYICDSDAYQVIVAFDADVCCSIGGRGFFLIL